MEHGEHRRISRETIIADSVVMAVRAATDEIFSAIGQIRVDDEASRKRLSIAICRRQYEKKKFGDFATVKDSVRETMFPTKNQIVAGLISYCNNVDNLEVGLDITQFVLPYWLAISKNASDMAENSGRLMTIFNEIKSGIERHKNG